MPKVLVADDQANMRWTLVHVLGEQGFEVVTAEDGEQAVGRVKQEAPQVILMDLKMPRLGGLQALEQIKESAPEVPVIVITAYGDVPSAVQAMKLGAYDFLTKPFDNEELLYTVKRAVERRELLSQVAAIKSRLQPAAPCARSWAQAQRFRRSFSRSSKWQVRTSLCSSRGRAAPARRSWRAPSTS